MVLLHLKTDNVDNIALAKFDTIYNQAYIQFSNITNNQSLYAGLSNNNLKIYNNNFIDDEGLIYNNNLLTINTINTKFIKNNNFTSFPNNYTSMGSYDITGHGFSAFPTEPFKCFDMNDNTLWQSVSTYKPDGSAITENNNYKFIDSFGDWIKIKFPYAIIPIGFSINSSGNIKDPNGFDVYASGDNITWTKLAVISNVNYNNVFYFNANTNFYLYVAIVITRIVSDPTFNSYQYFELKTLQILTRPIINFDTNIKISNNNIYNVETISAKKLILNDMPISSGTDINNALIAAAIAAFQEQYSIYWQNSNGTGYPDVNLINKIAINKTTANATLDINGNITYSNRIINKKLEITTINRSYASSYIFIGDIRINDTSTKSYFKISLYSYDTTKYYFQTINIHGYTFIEGSTVFKIYWDTVYDTTNAIQRIVDVVYILDFSLSKPLIKLFIKFNDLLDITYSQGLNPLRDFFNNIIYIDEFHTTTMTDVEFIPTTVVGTLNQQNFYVASNINSTQLNGNINYSFSNIITNIQTNQLKINNSSIKTSNLLLLDNNNNIADSGISSNIIRGLMNINLSSNKLVATNSIGSLVALDVSSNLLININAIAQTSSNILISSNGIFEPFYINKNNIDDLNTINIIPNSILIINSNNQIKTTTTVNIANISNVLNLFNFNFTNNYVFVNSNININTIKINSNFYIGDIIVNSNIKSNRLIVNSREIGDDIFKIIMKYPPDNLTPSVDILVATNNTRAYNITFNNNSFFNISITVDDDDDIESDIFKKPYNIFFKYSNRFWQTQNNFKDYRSSTNNIGVFRYIEGDTDNRTKCGAYITIELTQNFILTSYVLYVNYSNIINTMRDFKLFGFNKTTNIWTLIDYRIGVVLNNNLIANVFTINKNNYEIYSKYAICILNTHNEDGGIPAFCMLNYIDLYGYTPQNNNIYNFTNYSINSENNITLLGFNNIGISNLNPYAPLSIGNDFFNNSREALLNLNHPSLVSSNNLEKPIITITRPSNRFSGIKAIHYLNSWQESNANYTIKLTHNNNSNERVVLSLNSDGKIGIGDYPNSNHTNNGLSIFNNGLSLYNNSNYVNFQVGNISNSYNINFPTAIGSSNNTFYVEAINNNTAYLKWYDPLDLVIKQPYIKLGDQTVQTRNDNGVVLQIAGNCFIGSNNITSNEITTDFIKNNILVVAGSIYSTTDITTDSDISYKYNIELIKDPLHIINKINGYTFNRNDVCDYNNQRYTGLIAQEVIKVMPEVIIKKHDGKLRILYANLAGLFIEAIKKLDNNYNYLNCKINFCILTFSMGFLYLLNYKNA